MSANNLLGFHFDPEDGGDMLLRNIWVSPNYMALKFTRPYS
jgi:hypothetical protein